MNESFAPARQIADAVLYEGYVLYPYRATSRKNQVRWQFGVIAPQAWCAAQSGEHAWMQTECLVEPGDARRVLGCVRFLQLTHRSAEAWIEGTGFVPVDRLEAGDTVWTEWDEGIERTVEVALPLQAGEARSIELTITGGCDFEELTCASGARLGRLRRERWEIHGRLHVSAELAMERPELWRVRVRVENLTACAPDAARDVALRSALVGAHVLLSAEGGAFVSLVDPPEWASGAAKACQNVRAWPVLAGPDGDPQVVLASPIILYDHPKIAPESAGELYDGTEIDEILTLRTMTLTDEEKREARGTDRRAAAIIDRVDGIPAEMLEKLHGAIRGIRELTSGSVPEPPPPGAPWWDPGVDAAVDPDRDTVVVGGVTIAKGSRVRLRPGARRADAQDMFVAGKAATVQGVFLDIEEQRYVAVTLDDDPAADLQVIEGRFMYFYADELEPLAARVLVAGVGNVFLGDDGFGVEVARRLAGVALPAGAQVADFGIRGLHLAYQLLEGYDTLILVDAVARGGDPGTLYVIAPDSAVGPAPAVDAHSLDPASVLRMLDELGGKVGRTLVVGCEPSDTEERMGLSAPVEQAVDEAVRVVLRLVESATSVAPKEERT